MLAFSSPSFLLLPTLGLWLSQGGEEPDDSATQSGDTSKPAARPAQKKPLSLAALAGLFLPGVSLVFKHPHPPPPLLLPSSSSSSSSSYWIGKPDKQGDDPAARQQTGVSSPRTRRPETTTKQQRRTKTITIRSSLKRSGLHVSAT